jgi:hypothetical protein
MPEHDFELYLSLLSRFLRLKPAQHAEIADELRDHLEQRLEEFSSRGLSHDEAIRKALDEFGDAAELANHFTRAIHIRRRRLIMRCTMGTVAALAATLLVATAFWPDTQQTPLRSRIVAQEGDTGVQPEKESGAVPKIYKGRLESEAKLKKRLDQVTFLDMPLHQAIEFFSGETGLDILLDKPALSDEGIEFDQPVTLKITRTPIEAGLALKLILEPLQLGYLFRENLVMISTQAKLAGQTEIRVYNVRDLLVGVSDEKVVSAVAKPGSRNGLASVPSILPIVAAQIGQGFGDANPAETAPTSEGKKGSTLRTQAATLAEVLISNVEPESWGEIGGPGSVSEYNGLLVVNQTEAVHAKIEVVLELMRQSLRETKGKSDAGNQRRASKAHGLSPEACGLWNCSGRRPSAPKPQA